MKQHLINNSWKYDLNALKTYYRRTQKVKMNTDCGYELCITVEMKVNTGCMTWKTVKNKNFNN